MSQKLKSVLGSLLFTFGVVSPLTLSQAADIQCQDLSFLGEIYYAGLETYADACKTECEVVDNTTKEKIELLDEFIKNCTTNPNSTNCDKNTLDQLIGINYCFMEQLRNTRQNTLQNGLNDIFEQKVQTILQDKYAQLLNFEAINSIIRYLETDIENQFSGHYQQIWNFICDTAELYEPINGSSCNDLKQEMLNIYNNNSNAVTIAMQLKSLLQKFENNGNLLTTCVNVACEKGLEDLIFTQNTCHNYFVDTKNVFQNEKDDISSIWDFFGPYTRKVLEKKLLNSSYDVNKFADTFCGKLEEIRSEFGNTDLDTLLKDIEKRLVEDATADLCGMNENILLWMEY